MQINVNVEGSELVTDWFGYWPSFHDAEVLSIRLDRAPQSHENGPVVSAVIHAFQMTSEVTETGHYKFVKHCLIEFEFVSVDSVSLDGFNHQNALSGIVFSETTNELGQPAISVAFDPAYGIELQLNCTKVIVKSLKPGKPSEGVYV